MPARPTRATLRRLRRPAGVILAGLILVAVFAGGAGLERAGVLPGRVAEPTPAASAEFALFREAWDLLHREYVRAADLDSKALVYAAIDALAKAVGDTGHTRFLTPVDREAASQSLSGSFVGIGVEVDTAGDEVLIVGVFRGSPAERAGLRSGDVILAVDGVATADTPVDKVTERVRGPEGTNVRLAIRRTGTTDPLDVTVTRAKITRPAISWAMVPGTTIAAIRLEQFQSGAAEEFKQALIAAMAAKATGVIFDLRDDPGGYVDEARAIASQFLREGTVYRTRDAHGHDDPVTVVEGGVALDLPVVVLVDDGTASSSEITSGALQDAGRAKIVGVKTFGTGTVLAEFGLSDGSALRIGTVEWLTPNGRRIWHDGIAPDVTVTLADGVVPIVPDDLAELGADGVRSSKDAQFLKALDLLGGAPLR